VVSKDAVALAQVEEVLCKRFKAISWLYVEFSSWCHIFEAPSFEQRRVGLLPVRRFAGKETIQNQTVRRVVFFSPLPIH